MKTIDHYQLARLKKSIERLNEEYKLNAPEVIKKVELSIIKEICDNLQLNLN